jgi:hypothetical protein
MKVEIQEDTEETTGFKDDRDSRIDQDMIGSSR